VILDNAHLLPLVYIDIDTLVLPSLPKADTLFDVGLLDDPLNPSRPASALVWCHDGSVPFLKYWSRLCNCHPTRTDHPLMIQAYLRTKQEVRFKDLSAQMAGHWVANGLREPSPTSL
jgi:hypothetical protein